MKKVNKIRKILRKGRIILNYDNDEGLSIIGAGRILKDYEKNLPEYVKKLKDLIKKEGEEKINGSWSESRNLVSKHLGYIGTAGTTFYSKDLNEEGRRCEKVEDIFIKILEKIRFKRRDYKLRSANEAIKSGKYGSRDKYLDEASKLQRNLEIGGPEDSVAHEMIGDMYLKGEKPNLRGARYSYSKALFKVKGDKSRLRIEGKLEQVRKDLEKSSKK